MSSEEEVVGSASRSSATSRATTARAWAVTGAMLIAVVIVMATLWRSGEVDPALSFGAAAALVVGLPLSVQHLESSAQLAVALIGTVVLASLGAITYRVIPTDLGSQWAFGVVMLAILMLGGFALSWVIARDTAAQARWIEPLALVLSLAVGIALGSVIELGLLGELSQFGTWGMASVGACATVLLARMRASQWILGARLGPIIPVRTGPTSFRDRWEVSDQVLRVYAAEILPKNALLGAVTNTYEPRHPPGLGQCGLRLDQQFRESYAASGVIMPARQGVIIAPEGKTEELIVAGSLIGRYLPLDGCTVLADNAGPSDGAFLRIRVGELDQSGDTLAAAPCARLPIGAEIGEQPLRRFEYRSDRSSRKTAIGGHSHSSAIDESSLKPASVEETGLCQRGWIDYSEHAYQSELRELWAQTQADLAVSDDLRVATNGPDSLGFALGLLAGSHGSALGSARWEENAGYQKTAHDFAELAPNPSGPQHIQQERAVLPGERGGARRVRAAWYAKLLLGSFLITTALLMIGAALALSLEWALLASEQSPPWSGWLWTVIAAAIAGLAGMGLSLGVTSPQFALDLTGGPSSVGWRRRVIGLSAADESSNGLEVWGEQQARWIRRRLADIYAAFPSTREVSVKVPIDDGHREMWRFFGSSLKSAFKGPKPLVVTDGLDTIVVHPRSETEVLTEIAKDDLGATLRAILEGTGPKSQRLQADG